MPKVVVAGALGLIGSSAVAHFESLGWEVVGLSRRAQASSSTTKYMAVDLTSAESCAQLAALRDVDAVVYGALYESPDLLGGWFDPKHTEINTGMLRNLLDALEPGNPGLRHVTAMQGAKAYGVHLGPTHPPLKERAPRHIHPNFYWTQEDLLRERGARRGWKWTVFRPQGILGLATGSAMNPLVYLGVYAAISRELGLPLVFPGTGEDVVLEATDARLLAKAIAWAIDSPSAADEIFNITNGDVYTFRGLWPELARVFGMETGLTQPMPLVKVMSGKDAVWSRIVQRHGLQDIALDTLVGASWQSADFALSDRHGARSQLMSTIKIRQAGFADCIDTVDSYSWWWRDLQKRKLLPD
ncbi:SDR family oxidoreductase [Ramlibacter sp.]|uniref:SDR family oxidoreductase n=1 Tax=Ramlibacter sp. TaxID=1917967 RepID=UPI003D131E3F